MGHLEGDRILTEFGRIINESFRETDIKTRTGGDEFSIYIKDYSSLEKIKKKCENINKMLKEKTKNDLVSFSAGITAVKENETYEEMFHRADTALYKAKKSEKEGIIAIYGEDI